jgi:hypothetical protein
MTLAKRLKAMGAPKYQADGDPRTSGPGFAVTLHPQVLAEPYRWRGHQVVFVNSMSDLFQARSAKMLNGDGQASVIPEVFHQPSADYTEDAAISATLEREPEEQLLCRPELEAMASDSYVDPLFLMRLSPGLLLSMVARAG